MTQYAPYTFWKASYLNFTGKMHILKVGFLQNQVLDLLDNKELCSEKVLANFTFSYANNVQYIYRTHHNIITLGECLTATKIFEANTKRVTKCDCECGYAWCNELENHKLGNVVCSIAVDGKFLDKINNAISGDIIEFQTTFYNVINNIRVQEYDEETNQKLAYDILTTYNDYISLEKYSDSEISIKDVKSIVKNGEIITPNINNLLTLTVKDFPIEKTYN